jgi:hypothetical protein
MTKKQIIEWCDKQVAEGKRLTVGWEGGGDSGWAYFEIDGERVENPYTETIVDAMHNVLDYGSWAGEFSASGEAIYDSKEKAFMGEDNYSEEQSCSFGTDIDVRVPKKLWFEFININISGHCEEDPEVTISFGIKNGFTTDDHLLAIEKLTNEIDEEVRNEIDEFSKEYDFSSIWQNISINRNEMLDDSDELVYTINELSMNYNEVNTKWVCLSLEELDFENVKNQ